MRRSGGSTSVCGRPLGKGQLVLNSLTGGGDLARVVLRGVVVPDPQTQPPGSLPAAVARFKATAPRSPSRVSPRR